MIVPKLTLGRVIMRVDFAPKSLRYHVGRANFGERFYPTPYPRWEINFGALTLGDPAKWTKVTAASGVLTYGSDIPADLASLPEHLGELAAAFKEDCNPDSKIARIGLRAFYFLESQSFAETFPMFRANTLRHEKAWVQLSDYTIRDLGFTSIYYGTEEDGLNLGIGVLTAKQAEHFIKSESYLGSPPPDVSIMAGGLMIDLDRYKQSYDGEVGTFCAGALSEGDQNAEALAQRVLR